MPPKHVMLFAVSKSSTFKITGVSMLPMHVIPQEMFRSITCKIMEAYVSPTCTVTGSVQSLKSKVMGAFICSHMPLVEQHKHYHQIINSKQYSVSTFRTMHLTVCTTH